MYIFTLIQYNNGGRGGEGGGSLDIAVNSGFEAYASFNYMYNLHAFLFGNSLILIISKIHESYK